MSDKELLSILFVTSGERLLFKYPTEFKCRRNMEKGINLSMLNKNFKEEILMIF